MRKWGKEHSHGKGQRRRTVHVCLFFPLALLCPLRRLNLLFLILQHFYKLIHVNAARSVELGLFIWNVSYRATPCQGQSHTTTRMEKCYRDEFYLALQFSGCLHFYFHQQIQHQPWAWRSLSWVMRIFLSYHMSSCLIVHHSDTWPRINHPDWSEYLK